MGFRGHGSFFNEDYLSSFSAKSLEPLITFIKEYEENWEDSKQVKDDVFVNRLIYTSYKHENEFESSKPVYHGSIETYVAKGKPYHRLPFPLHYMGGIPKSAIRFCSGNIQLPNSTRFFPRDFGIPFAVEEVKASLFGARRLVSVIPTENSAIRLVFDCDVAPGTIIYHPFGGVVMGESVNDHTAVDEAAVGPLISLPPLEQPHSNRLVWQVPMEQPEQRIVKFEMVSVSSGLHVSLDIPHLSNSTRPQEKSPSLFVDATLENYVLDFSLISNDLSYASPVFADSNCELITVRVYGIPYIFVVAGANCLKGSTVKIKFGASQMQPNCALNWPSTLPLLNPRSNDVPLDCVDPLGPLPVTTTTPPSNPLMSVTISALKEWCTILREDQHLIEILNDFVRQIYMSSLGPSTGNAAFLSLPPETKNADKIKTTLTFDEVVKSLKKLLCSEAIFIPMRLGIFVTLLLQVLSTVLNPHSEMGPVRLVYMTKCANLYRRLKTGFPSISLTSEIQGIFKKADTKLLFRVPAESSVPPRRRSITGGEENPHIGLESSFGKFAIVYRNLEDRQPQKGREPKEMEERLEKRPKPKEKGEGSNLFAPKPNEETAEHFFPKRYEEGQRGATKEPNRRPASIQNISLAQPNKEKECHRAETTSAIMKSIREGIQEDPPTSRAKKHKPLSFENSEVEEGKEFISPWSDPQYEKEESLELTDQMDSISQEGDDLSCTGEGAIELSEIDQEELQIERIWMKAALAKFEYLDEASVIELEKSEVVGEEKKTPLFEMQLIQREGIRIMSEPPSERALLYLIGKLPRIHSDSTLFVIRRVDHSHEFAKDRRSKLAGIMLEDPTLKDLPDSTVTTTGTPICIEGPEWMGVPAIFFGVKNLETNSDCLSTLQATEIYLKRKKSHNNAATGKTDVIELEPAIAMPENWTMHCYVKLKKFQCSHCTLCASNITDEFVAFREGRIGAVVNNNWNEASPQSVFDLRSASTEWAMIIVKGLGEFQYYYVDKKYAGYTIRARGDLVSIGNTTEKLGQKKRQPLGGLAQFTLFSYADGINDESLLTDSKREFLTDSEDDDSKKNEAGWLESVQQSDKLLDEID